ncbi:MAG: VCBS repeat-containing protein, partial [Planctomycetaceae bacterium]|nr:VCBS repeat-containing protein [Planctomycetaceae bacterium]
SNLQDGTGQGIFAQRFDQMGTPDGGEFQVNTWTTGDQAFPTVAMDADGDFVIAWRSTLQDGAEYGVYAQRFNSLGVAQGSEFLVNSHTSKGQQSPSVAMNAQGDFVIAWESYLQDGSTYGIYAQRYNSMGGPQGAEFQVNSFTASQQRYPAVAVDSQGDFVIAWQTYGPDGGGYGIYAQRYLLNGSPDGPNFQVNSFTSGWQITPSVAMDSDGDLVFAWQSAAQDGSSDGVYAQRFLKVGQRDDLGVWRAGKFYLDSNHSSTWNGPATDTLNTFGNSTDTPLAGDWNGDGYDEIGVWRNGTFFLDSNGNGIWDGPATDSQFSFGNPTDTPLVGDWNNDGIDDIGVWRAGKFYLDLNGNRAWNGPAIDTFFSFGISTDQPVVGDWNADGTDDVGVRRDRNFYLDSNGNRMWNAGVDEVFGFGIAADTPIIGDWNGDGTDDVGVWRAGKFYLDATPDHVWNSFFDLVVPFGSVTDMPLIGYWRSNPPPAPALTTGALPPSSSQVSVPSATPQPDEQTLASLLAIPIKKRDL